MNLKLIGPLNFDKLENYFRESGHKDEEIKREIDYIKTLIKERNASLVSSAGTLSRFDGNVLENLSQKDERSFEQNVKTVEKISGMGHNSILDHAYFVFALNEVSVVMEQILIAERYASFTIKSRREVDISKDGFYIPTFRNKDYELHKNNQELQQLFFNHSSELFKTYSGFIEKGVKKEDARYLLPYSFYSNIVMGFDVHTIKDMIIKFTKTHYSQIAELNSLGQELYRIAKENFPYIIKEIDSYERETKDQVYEYLTSSISKDHYQSLFSPILLNHSKDVDDTILIASIMRRYQYSYDKAERIYKEACKSNPNFKLELMRKIAFESDKLEFAQVNFQYQVPLSYAVLTHLTRHRTHPIMVPEFTTADLTQYKIPPKIHENRDLTESFDASFMKNIEMYEYFKRIGVCEEDLIYFTLSGNITNAITNLDGKTLAHILALRECSKAQWETQGMAWGMHKELARISGAEIFSSVLGPTCITQGYCKEGSESCGRILRINQNK